MSRMRFLVVFLLLAIGDSFAQIRSEEYTISNCITTFSEERVIKNSTGWAFWFIPAGGIADTLSVKMSCVDQGIKTHEPHSHYEDELFYMVKGTSIVHLNGEEYVLRQGDAFYAPGNSSHNIRRVDRNQPILYLMFKREIRGKLAKPYLPSVANYAMKDCLRPFNNAFLTENGDEKTMWYLAKEMSAGGLNTRLCLLSEFSQSKKDNYLGQEVYFILEGKAEVMLNGESRVIEPLSSFYCPPNSTHSIRNVGNGVLKYIITRTK